MPSAGTPGKAENLTPLASWRSWDVRPFRQCRITPADIIPPASVETDVMMRERLIAIGGGNLRFSPTASIGILGAINTHLVVLAQVSAVPPHRSQGFHFESHLS